MSSLDILLILPSTDAGGAERVTLTLANGLRAAGMRPRLLLTHRSGALQQMLDTRVPVTESGRARLRAAVPGLIRAVRDDPPDVIFATHTHVNLALCGIRSWLPRSTRLVLREPIFAPVTLEGRSTRWTRRAQRAFYPRADLLLASSEVMANDLRALTRRTVEVLPNPVDQQALRAKASVSHGEAERSLEPDTPRDVGDGRLFVSIGRLARQKATDDLLRAFSTAAKSEDRLVIFGEGPDRARLEGLIVELRLTDRVELRGVRPDHLRTLAAADLLVLASHEEGMPNAVLEALAVGTPALATTDLVTLGDLSRSAPPGAVRLVERHRLAAELQGTPRLSLATAALRTSLLPAEHDIAMVTQRFLALTSSDGDPCVS